jgi:hypothetical protein
MLGSADQRPATRDPERPGPRRGHDAHVTLRPGHGSGPPGRARSRCHHCRWHCASGNNGYCAHPAAAVSAASCDRAAALPPSPGWPDWPGGPGHRDLWGKFLSCKLSFIILVLPCELNVVLLNSVFLAIISAACLLPLRSWRKGATVGKMGSVSSCGADPSPPTRGP